MTHTRTERQTTRRYSRHTTTCTLTRRKPHARPSFTTRMRAFEPEPDRYGGCRQPPCPHRIADVDPLQPQTSQHTACATQQAGFERVPEPQQKQTTFSTRRHQKPDLVSLAITKPRGVSSTIAYRRLVSCNQRRGRRDRQTWRHPHCSVARHGHSCYPT